MEYYYHGSGTASVINGEVVTGMTLERLFEYGGKVPVGTVTNTYCRGFFSQTQIMYSEGSLSYYEDYDMPPAVYTHPFDIAFQENEKRLPLTLHKPAMIDPQRYSAFFLEEAGVYYQILIREAERDRLWHICVFDAAFSVVNKQLCHSPLADVVIRKQEAKAEFNVHIRRELTLQLQMAIVSLPFTCRILPETMSRMNEHVYYSI